MRNMNFKNLIRFIAAILSLVIISIFLHEFVHIIQLYYFYGVPLENIEIHFFWERIISDHSITRFPLVWISYVNWTATEPISHLFMEAPAYFIQYTFIFLIYFKFIYKNEKFKWR